MDIEIFDSVIDVAEFAAQHFKKLLVDKPNCVLGLATGATPLALYSRLTAIHHEQNVSFKNVKSFNLDEYVGLHVDHPDSYRSYMQKHFFNVVDIDVKNTHVPTCLTVDAAKQVSEEYESAINVIGGIDLQILGIGRNGHIGFNEPGSSFTTKTRMVSLSKETIQANAPYFSMHTQPSYAITMGIDTIMQAKQILLLATGSRKADAVYSAVNLASCEKCPASVLQSHHNVTLVLDRLAAAKLSI